MAVSAYILIQTEVGKAAKVASEVGAVDGVVAADDVTGPYDVIAQAEAATVDDLGHARRQPHPDDRRHHPHPHLPGGEPVGSGAADEQGPDAEAHQEQAAEPVEQVQAAAQLRRGTSTGCRRR